jgi:hypothetical protein
MGSHHKGSWNAVYIGNHHKGIEAMPATHFSHLEHHSCWARAKSSTSSITGDQLCLPLLLKARLQGQRQVQAVEPLDRLAAPGQRAVGGCHQRGGDASATHWPIIADV